MTENMGSDSPTKKRKANDGRATVPGGGGGLFSSLLGYFYGRRDDNAPTASTTCGGENLTQMDTVVQMMRRMEERQLVNMSSLEMRCANLEAMLKTKMEQDESKFDSLVRHHEYNTMLVKNQSWEYSTPVHSAEQWQNDGYEEDEAEYLSEYSDFLKDFTEKMRRGEFPNDYGNEKGIDLDWGEGDPILDRAVMDKMRPHWREFADALKQFTPAFGVLPDDCETFFALQDIQLPGNVAWRLRDALMNKPFQTLRFVNKTGVRNNEGISLDSIMDIVNSNEHLRNLTIGNILIGSDDIAKICSAVRYGSIVELNLQNCFDNGLGDAMVTSLLRNGGLAKLESLGLESARITSSSITLLAGFLATNTTLKYLDLEGNGLNDNDALVLANALRSNTSLGYLRLHSNTISEVGEEAFDLVVHGDGNLNSIADSNHRCEVIGLNQFDCRNVDRQPESFNRARKIYNLLSKRNKSMSASNVQYFDSIDVKILPTMLKAVQSYASVVYPDDRYSSGYCRVEPLSIVYEVMRKWDNVFPLYTDGGNI